MDINMASLAKYIVYSIFIYSYNVSQLNIYDFI